MLTQAEENQLVLFAFRYALGRISTAPSFVVSCLEKIWDDLPPNTQRQIQNEISHTIELGMAGQAVDVILWKSVLDLPVSIPDVV